MSLQQFAREVIQGAFEGADWDGFEIQELGVKCGLLKKVPFDPAKHVDPEGFCEAGDWWYEFTGPLAGGSDAS